MSYYGRLERVYWHSNWRSDENHPRCGQRMLNGTHCKRPPNRVRNRICGETFHSLLTVVGKQVESQVVRDIQFASKTNPKVFEVNFGPPFN